MAMRIEIFMLLMVLAGCGQSDNGSAVEELKNRNGTQTHKTLPAMALLPDEEYPEDANQLSELSIEQARRLRAVNPLTLELNGLNSIEPDVAGYLAQVTIGPPDSPIDFSSVNQHSDQVPLLALNGLTSLPIEVARALAPFPGELQVNGLRELDPQIATTLLFYPQRTRNPRFQQAEGVMHGSVSLDGLPSLDLALSQSLAMYRGWRLSLRGLRSLSPEVAKVLAEYEGTLILDGLDELPPLIAECFKKKRGDIHLNGLTSLSTDSAKAITSRNDGYSGSLRLHLNGLGSLSPELAQILAMGSASVHLDGVKTLSREVEEIIAEGSSQLSLRGLVSLSSPRLAAKGHDSIGGVYETTRLASISPPVAKVLASYRTSVLNLNGLTTIDEETASALGGYVGDQGDFGGIPFALGELRLNGLKDINESIARALVKSHVTENNTSGSWALSLDGLSALTPETARELAACSGSLSLSGLTQCPADIATILGSHRGLNLTLDGVTSLSLDAARAITAHSHHISLGGLQAISPEIAKALASGNCSLGLGGLKTLSAACAAELSLSKLPLSLGVRELSPEAEALLAKKETLIYPRVGIEVNLSTVKTASLAKVLVEQQLQRGASAISLSAAEITPEVARVLASAEVEALYLNSLTRLGADVAKELATFSGSLHLGMPSLSVDESRALAAHEGQALVLLNVRAMPVEAIAALAPHEKTLVIDGVFASDPLIAQAWASHAGPIEVGPGLTQLTSPDFARKLSSSSAEEHYLDLTNLYLLSPAAASVLTGHVGTLGIAERVLDDPSVREAIASHVGPIEVFPLTKLNSEVLAARLLETVEEHLDLTGLVELSPAAASVIAKHNGSLGIASLVVENPEVAETLASHAGPIEVWGRLTQLSSAAFAKKLADSAQHGLELDHISEISPEVAASLASCEGFLSLAALKQLDVAVAERLAHHEGELCLDAVTSLSSEAASALASHAGPLFMRSLTSLDSPALATKLLADAELDSVRSITVMVADALVAIGEDHTISLPGLKVLPADVAVALGKSKGFLELDSLESLDVDAARSLMQEQRWGLSLNGLRELDSPVAEQLAKLEGDLELNGLKVISEPVARALASKEYGDLSLNGLAEASPEVAALLATKASGSIALNGLVMVPAELITAFADYAGHLQLNGIRTLDLDTAELLAGLKCSIECKGLTELTSVPLAKKLLSNTSGLVHLGEVRSLSADVAAELAEYEGTVWLDGLSDAPDKVTKILRSNPRIRLPAWIPY